MSTPRVAPTPIATLRLEQRTSRGLALHCEFSSGDVVDVEDVGTTDSIRDACRKAGEYLNAFAAEIVGTQGRNPARLTPAFTALLDGGRRLAAQLVGDSADEADSLAKAFQASWPWRQPTDGVADVDEEEVVVIPLVQLVADDAAAAAFPLELLPMFDLTGEVPCLENASVVDQVASRLLGFTTVIARIVPRTNRNSEVLRNDPLPVLFVRYLDYGWGCRLREWLLRLLGKQSSAIDGFEQEEEFLVSLRRRGLVSLDGPWPSPSEPAAKVVDHVIDALHHGPVELAHLACHCETEAREGDDYEIRLSSHIRINLRQILLGYVTRGCEVVPSPMRRVPVILNACRTSTFDPWSAQSFQSLFLNNRHGAFVGTLAPIRDADAADYAERLYRFLLGGLTLGEAVLLARRQLLMDAGSPLGILYVHYGNDRFAVENRHPDELPSTLAWKSCYNPGADATSNKAKPCEPVTGLS